MVLSDRFPAAFGDLAERLLTHLPEGDAAHDRGHVLRVWSLCRTIAEGEGRMPDRALLAAALLHDLVALPKDHPDRKRASTLSAEAARPILAAEGLSGSEINEASHAIAAHSYSAGIEPLTDAARILRDADRIEALGAIGIARTFAVSGSLGRPLWDAGDPFAAARPLDDGAFGLDHFEVKLLGLADAMLTETGRRIARARTEVMRGFLDDLRAELEPK
ncbi:HD domain-containing protein [Alphaproteobacteria bacterium GH1-50]|uniref:HD domain-containing protein n=1 Tax=Kangsaoukella pontilimi TaxID=2691042 RepID=A0A7C9MRI2_9RHOB|nr:HD domain-containing protein [Kangsaoukella pontilimi]MXQ08337.1 HD domain-containing protein [Kangsaoukella pontilimi]